MKVTRRSTRPTLSKDIIELRETYNGGSTRGNYANVLTTITADDVVISMNGKAEMTIEEFIEFSNAVKQAHQELS